MRWTLIAILSFVLLVLEKGLATLWEIGGVTPRPLLVVAVFLALVGTTQQAPWACLALGALIDLTTPFRLPGTDEDFVVLGPMSLGFLAAGTLAVQMRGSLFRDSAVSLATLAFVCGLLAELTAVAVLSLRGLPFLTAQPLDPWNWADELVNRFFGLIYTAGVGLPLAWTLVRMEPVLGITPRTGASAYRVRRVV